MQHVSPNVTSNVELRDLPADQQTFDGSHSEIARHTFDYDNRVAIPRTRSSWLLSANRPLSINYQFDVAGNVTGTTNPRGNTTSYKYNDVLDRLTEANLPDGVLTIFGYCDAGSNQGCPSSSPLNSITKSVKQDSCSQTNSIVTAAIYDGFGRAAQSCYDPAGRPPPRRHRHHQWQSNQLSNVPYAPQTAIQTANLGNGLTETRTYNKSPKKVSHKSRKYFSFPLSPSSQIT